MLFGGVGFKSISGGTKLLTNVTNKAGRDEMLGLDMVNHSCIVTSFIAAISAMKHPIL